MNLNLDSIQEDLIEISRFCAEKNLVPATSGNFSAKLSPNEILISISGKDKAKLKKGDFMIVNESGESYDSGLKPSAETLLHTQIYNIFPDINYIAHFHSSSSAVLSKILINKGIYSLKLEGFELLKALSGVSTHEHSEIIPIFHNSQNISELAAKIEPYLKAGVEVPQSGSSTVAEHTSSRLRRTNDRSVPLVHEDHEDDENAEIEVRQQCLHGYLLAGHGLYTWGSSAKETIRHADALNTLIESYLLEMQLCQF